MKRQKIRQQKNWFILSYHTVSTSLPLHGVSTGVALYFTAVTCGFSSLVKQCLVSNFVQFSRCNNEIVSTFYYYIATEI